jgi:hypothetical protein
MNSSFRQWPLLGFIGIALTLQCQDKVATPGYSYLHTLLTNPQDGPAAGNPGANDPVPAGAGVEDTTNPDHVVGNGTPESCTGDAFIDAVARGGKICFHCGPNPVIIRLARPAKVFNDSGSNIVIDGGGMVTLDGQAKTRILYMNTCDQNQHWTTPHCDNQALPHLTVQNLTFVNADSRNESDVDNRGGGGAIWVRGGRFKVVNCRFFNNLCAESGPDVGGGAIRVFSQYNDSAVYVVNSTFGGADSFGNVGSNGGALSSIGVSWTIINCLFGYNKAIGNGGNPSQTGTSGGGSGGAIYNDGNTMTLALYGTRIEYNEVNAYGSAIFFISNNYTGTLHIENSVIRSNIGGSWYTLPGISMNPSTRTDTLNSIIQ